MPRSEDPTARARILDAAGRLFYERGIHDVGMAEVVAAAGTGKNVLYRHFPGKDELVLAYLEESAKLLDAAMDAAVADLPPDEALVAVARQVAHQASRRGYRGCPFRNYVRETRDTKGRPGRFALAQVRALRRRIDELSTRAGVEDPERLADRIWLTLEGAYAAAPYPERVPMAEAAVAHVEELVSQSPHSSTVPSQERHR